MQSQKWQLSGNVVTANVTTKMRNTVTFASWSAVPVAGHHSLKMNLMKTRIEIIKKDERFRCHNLQRKIGENGF